MQNLFVALLATFIAHAASTVATLTAPILAPYLHVIYGVEGRYIGLYSSIVYFGSLIATVASVQLIKSIGAANALKAALILAMLGMALLLVHSQATFFLSAVVIGLAFGPMNPVSSVILAGVCPPKLRGRVFSVKQGAVPLGAGIAALAIPFVYANFGARTVVVAVIAVCLAGLTMVLATSSFVQADIGKSDAKPPLMALPREFRRTFSHGELTRIAFISTGLASVQFTFAPTLIYVLVTHGGFEATFASGLLSLVMLVSFFLRPTFGALADWFGARIVVVCIAIAMIVFSMAFPFIITGTFRYAVAAATIIYGASCFSWNGVLLSMLANRAPRELIGEATAGTMAISLVGASMAPLVFTALLTVTHGLILAYFSLAGFAALALVFALSIGKNEPVEGHA